MLRIIAWFGLLVDDRRSDLSNPTYQADQRLLCENDIRWQISSLHSIYRNMTPTKGWGAMSTELRVMSCAYDGITRRMEYSTTVRLHSGF